MNIGIKAVRFIPFDIGKNLDAREMNLIENALSKYKRVHLSNIQQAILSKNAISCSVYADGSHELLLNVFDTGIGVFVIRESMKEYPMRIQFAAEYLSDRKMAHKKILEWDHPLSPIMREVIDDLRQIVKHRKGLRISSSASWEYGGISYVMTIAFLSLPFIQTAALDWDMLPDETQKGIHAILNPSLLFLEDSLKVDYDGVRPDEQFLLESLNGMNHQPHDYELRKHIMTFMSWAAVLIVGNYTKTDEDEYICLEIELQHYWFYIYCLENSLPIREDVARGKIIVEEIVTKKLETDLIEENLKMVNDTSIPERFYSVIQGLIQTSGILEQLNRYRKKLDYCKEIYMIKQQTKQKLLSQSSEILLFLVAYLQITPIVYQFLINRKELQFVVDFFHLNPQAKSFILIVLLFVGFLMGALVLAFKNRYIKS